MSEVQTVTTNLEAPRKVRHSGVDLLRIIAIFLICIFHANQMYLLHFDPSTLDTFSQTLSSIIVLFGPMGNILFVICSSYFLVDKTKSRAEKAINILFDSMVISISILIGFLISGEPLDNMTIVQQIFTDVYQNNWFVPCYVIFYLLAPIAVVGLKHLNKKSHFILIVVLLIAYGVLAMVKLQPVGSSLLQFFYIFTIVAFVKWYCPNFCNKASTNLIIFIVGILIHYALFLVTRIYTEQIPITLDLKSLFAPLLVIPLVCLFNLFNKMPFYNKFISYLSGCSLFVYVIHENYLLKTITRVRYFHWAIDNYGFNLSIVYILLCGLFMFIAGFILAVIYKETIHRLTSKLSVLVNNGLTKFFKWLYGKTFKEESSDNNN